MSEQTSEATPRVETAPLSLEQKLQAAFRLVATFYAGKRLTLSSKVTDEEDKTLSEFSLTFFCSKAAAEEGLKLAETIESLFTGASTTFSAAGDQQS